MNGINGYTQQSLLTALNRFVEAVNSMEGTVMVPSKLRDMEVSCVSQLTEENNNAGYLRPGSSATGAANTKAVVPTIPAGADLYGFYAMLNAIKREIITGPQPEDDNDSMSSTSNDETSKKTAAAFRHHLRGLFDLLHQLTETARYLTTRYESEVTTSNSQLTPFTL